MSMRLALAMAAIGSAFSATAAPAASEEDGYFVMADFGQCVARSNKRAAIDLLNLEPGSRIEHEAGVKLSKRWENCLRTAGKLRFQPLLLRGTLAQALYKQDFGRAGPGTVKPLGFGASWMADASASTVSTERRQQNLALYGFAACVATAQPEAAHRLTMSDFDSIEEKRALASMRVAFAPCYPKGGKATFNRTSLRALLAEALFRVATEPRLVPLP